jgi:uncharacterized protein (TIRG00374 family)
MKKRSKQILSISYLVIVFTVTLILAVTLSKEGEGLFSVISTLNIYWLGAALFCMALYFLFETWTVSYITSFMYGRMRFFYVMKMDLIGSYYGALTPAAIGFMPAQVAYFKRDGVPVGISTFIQILKLMAYEAVIVFLCLIFMSIRGQFFFSNRPEIFWVSVFGALVNISVITIMILAIKKQYRLKKMVMGITRFLAKIRIIKNTDKMLASAEKTLGEFHDSAQYISKYKWKVAKACLLTLAQWLMFFLIPYCLYNAFGLGLLQGKAGAFGTVFPLDEAVTIVAMAAFLFLAVHFMPVPGSSGATEAGFGIFFGSFFFGYSIAAMFIWRLITYYSMILIGFIVIVADRVFRKRKKPEPLPDGS